MTESKSSPRRVAAKTFAAGAIAAAISIVCARLVLGGLVHQARSDDRFQQFVDHMPAVCSTRDAIVVLGSSLTRDGFSPSAFDAKLHAAGIDATTFNAGIEGLTPDLMLPLARRLQQCFADAKTAPRAIIIEFSPHMATRSMVRARLEAPTNSMRMQSVLDFEGFARIARRSPEEAGHQIALWSLGGNSPAAAHKFFNDWLFPKKPDVTEERTERLAQLKQTAEFKAVVARFRKLQKQGWSLERRGEIELAAKTPQEDAIWREVRTTDVARLERQRDWLIRNYDIIDLDFDPELVGDVIATVRVAQAITPNTYLLLFPRNPKWSKPSPLGASRLDDALGRIERETGVPILNLVESSEFRPDDFGDAAHIEWTNGAKVSGVVASWLVPRLAK